MEKRKLPRSFGGFHLGQSAESALLNKPSDEITENNLCEYCGTELSEGKKPQCINACCLARTDNPKELLKEIRQELKVLHDTEGLWYCNSCRGISHYAKKATISRCSCGFITIINRYDKDIKASTRKKTISDFLP